MKNEILNNLNDPRQLERLYRTNKLPFKRAFAALYHEVKGNTIADFWNERLNYESDDEIIWGTSNQLIFMIIASLVAGLIAKLPAFLSINEEVFYTRNIGFIVFPILSTYFAWKNKLSLRKIVFIVVSTLAGLIYINLLPNVTKSNTSILSCVHLILFLWCVLGFAFVGQIKTSNQKRLGYLKYNGDLVVMTGLILIAGGIMTAITINLFSLIGFNIEKHYFDYVGIFGLAAAPVVATYLTQTNPHLVGKVSPVIAKIFSPLVLVMLVIYLVAIIYSRKNPYNDREFLIIFNALLIGVMAIIFFSIAETSKVKSRTEVWVLFMLAAVTIIVNVIALSAIGFRIAQFGVTPNRAAVLGGNGLILINLILATLKIFRILIGRGDITDVGNSIASYLPVYFLWTAIVTFIFPLLFNFK